MAVRVSFRHAATRLRLAANGHESHPLRHLHSLALVRWRFGSASGTPRLAFGSPRTGTNPTLSATTVPVVDSCDGSDSHWKSTAKIGAVKKPEIPTIAEAVEKFLADAKAQKLSAETIRKYESLLNRRFLPWCESKGFRLLKQLGVEEMRQFRATWTDGAIYATKNLERLRAFFRFCMHDDWIAKNPARAVKAPQAADKPTLPFSQREMKRILDACDGYPGNRDPMRAFVLVMRYSDLRIGDTIALDERRLDRNKLAGHGKAALQAPVAVPAPGIGAGVGVERGGIPMPPRPPQRHRHPNLPGPRKHRTTINLRNSIASCCSCLR
jgi:hypothetical protein